MTTTTLVIVTAILLCTVAKLTLNRLNAKHIIKLRGHPPEYLGTLMDTATWQKSTDYSLAKSSFGIWSNLYGTFVALLALVLFMPWAYETWAGASAMGPWREAMVLVVIFIILGLPDLPFEWFNQFRLEERFGFNKSSFGLWVSDKLKA